jgi:NitT/TauT family transport system substrate-binding protein
MQGRRTVLAGLAALPVWGLTPGKGRAADRRVLRVGYIPIIPMTQLFIIEGEGWARAAGLDLTLTRFASGPAMVQALASGSLDVAYVGIGPVMVARARGVALTVVAANIIDQVALVGRGRLVEIMAAAPSPRDGFARFRRDTGRPAKIATLPQGSVPEAVLRYYLDEAAKADRGDVEVVGVGEDQVQQLLLAGAVDAGSITEPILTIVLERDPSARVIAAASAMLPRQPGAVIAVTHEALARDRDAIAELVALHVRATRFARTDPERTVRAVAEFIGKGIIDTSLLRKALASDATRLISDPRAIVASTRLLQDFQRRNGTLSVAVDIDALFDSSFFEAAEKR